MRINRPVTQRQCWWLLATAVSVLAPLARQLPLWLVAAITGTLLIRGLLTYRQWRLPPRWLLVPLTFIGTGLVLWHYRTLVGRVPGIALLAVLLSLKLLELRVARDALTVVLLAYFLVLAQFMFDQGIPAGLLAVLSVVITTATLAAASDDRPPPLALVRRCAIMLLQGIPFMLVLFILFPRIDGPLWGLPQDRHSATSGLSDSMSPGSIAQLAQSDAVAFRVKFDGPVPPQSQLYWRGPVMSDYDGRTWRVTQRNIVRPQVPYLIDNTARDAIRYELTLEPHGQRWLMVLEMPDAPPANAGLTSDLQFLSNQAVRTRLRYTQTSVPDTAFGQDETPQELASALTLPRSGNPRIREVAATWRVQANSQVGAGDTAITATPAADALILKAAEEFFLRQLLAYTLTPPLLGENAVDDFVFGTKKGFCEHFASAFVFALRAAGVPARVVAGYQGGEINPVDGFLVVRQYDAHAWTEVWLSGRGWVRIDPTAITMPRRIADNFISAVPSGEPIPLFARADLSWLRAVRNRFDAVANGWNQMVLGYNAAKQREFLQNLGIGEPDWRRMTALLAGICGVLMLLLTTWILWQRQKLDPALRIWQNFARKLERRGIQWQPWEGPLDFAQRAGEHWPERREQIHAFAQRYARLRYARTTDEGKTSALNALRRALRAI
ncbi:MAG: DUF3488 domain-containing transglutaminase family protein [Rhodocyclaceae bacterium]|jgi:transglutaminase-like putative cysteine protease|nr:DUF3488 domain-containing transglutaminase family protein [Rhodocyclaceae bacterium]MBK6907798.1 DUF3488 domain-containing transglutaminase family protein [Rhodocyclaceae bacterium]